jgi:transposase
MPIVPNGLVVEDETYIDDTIQLTVRAAAEVAACPLCGALSRRVHSRYTRNVSDLPSSGRAVRLLVVTRRFRCQAAHCPRRIFSECFGDTIIPFRIHRTARLDGFVHHLGLALGGRPAACFAKRLLES